MSWSDYYCVNRTVCDVLKEMRGACESANYSYMPGLIEELQSLGNKMEAALAEVSDFKGFMIKKSEMKKELKELEKAKKQAGGDE